MHVDYVCFTPSFKEESFGDRVELTVNVGFKEVLYKESTLPARRWLKEVAPCPRGLGIVLYILL